MSFDNIISVFSIVHHWLSITECQYGFQWRFLFIFKLLSFFNRRPFTFYINTKISIYISGTNISWLYNSTSTHVSTRQMETLVQHIAINRTYHFVFISRICLPHNYSIFKFMDWAEKDYHKMSFYHHSIKRNCRRLFYI